MADEQQQAPQSVPAPQKSGSGLEPNVAGLLSYVFGFVTGIIFLLIEKDNKFVRFHAMQSILFSATGYIIYFILSSLLVPAVLTGQASGFALLSLLSSAVSLALLVLWIMLMVKAYGNQQWELPIIGKIAKNFSSK